MLRRLSIVVFILILSSFSGLNIFSQEGMLTVTGKMKAKYGEITKAKLLLYEKDKLIETYTFTNTGKFQIELDYLKDYVVAFTKDGYVEKKISFNTDVPSDFDNINLGPVDFILDLYPMAEGLDFEIFEKPIAQVTFDDAIENFSEDMAYSSKIRSKVKSIEDEIDRIYKNLGKDKVEEVLDKFEDEARKRRIEENKRKELSSEDYIAKQKQFKEEAEKRKEDELKKAEQERQRMIAQVKAQEEAERKRLQAEEKRKEEEEAARLAKLMADKEALMKAQREKARQDSIANAQRLEALRSAAEQKKKEEEAIRKAEEEARLAKIKAEQELARQRAEAERKRLEAEEARLLAEKKARDETLRKMSEEEARIKEEQEAKRMAELLAQKEALKKQEEERARLEAEENARRQAQLAAENEARRKAEEEARRIAEQELTAKLAKMQDDAAARRKAEEEAKEAERLRLIEEMQAEYEAMKQQELTKYEQKKSDFFIGIDDALNSFINDFDKQYPNGKTVETYDFEHWTITKIIIKDDRKTIQYLKVEHHWGPIFYFKREEVNATPVYFCISETIFEIETDIV